MSNFKQTTENAEDALPTMAFEPEPTILDKEAIDRLKASLKPGEDILDYIEPASDPREESLPKILGHQLSLKEWNAFEAYAKTATIKAAAELCGLSTATIQGYRKEAWWGELFNIFIQERQQDLHAGLVAMTDDAIDAVRRILHGELEVDAKGQGEGRYAGAMMQAVQLLTRLGKSPLQDARSVTNIDARSLTNNGIVHISRDRLEALDQDDMLKMITGQVRIE